MFPHISPEPLILHWATLRTKIIQYMYDLQVQLREISHQFVLQKHIGIMKTLKKKRCPQKDCKEKNPSFTKIPELNTYTLIAFENVFFPIHGATESDLFLARVSGEAGRVMSQLQQHSAIRNTVLQSRDGQQLKQCVLHKPFYYFHDVLVCRHILV